MKKRFNWNGCGPIVLGILSLVWSLWTTPLVLDNPAVGSCLPTESNLPPA